MKSANNELISQKNTISHRGGGTLWRQETDAQVHLATQCQNKRVWDRAPGEMVMTYADRLRVERLSKHKGIVIVQRIVLVNSDEASVGEYNSEIFEAIEKSGFDLHRPASWRQRDSILAGLCLSSQLHYYTSHMPR